MMRQTLPFKSSVLSFVNLIPAVVQIHYLAHKHHIKLPIKKTHGRKDLKIPF